jgi:hypothetical protein
MKSQAAASDSLVTVALANKMMARMILALLVKGGIYRKPTVAAIA